MRLPGLNPRRSSSVLLVLTFTNTALDLRPRMEQKNGSKEPKDAWVHAASHLPRAGGGRGSSPPAMGRSKCKSRTPPPGDTGPNGKSSNEVGGAGFGDDGWGVSGDGGGGSGDEWEAKLDAAVAGAMPKFLPSLQHVVADSVGECRKVLKTHDKKLDQHTNQIQGRSERQVGFANEQLHLRRQVEEMRAKLALDTGAHLGSSSSGRCHPSQRGPDE